MNIDSNTHTYGCTDVCSYACSFACVCCNTQSITTFHLFILLLIRTLAGGFGGVQKLPLGSRCAHSGVPDSLITAGRRCGCDASAWPRNMHSSMASSSSESYSGSGSRRPTSTPRSCKLHFGTSPAMCIAILSSQVCLPCRRLCSFVRSHTFYLPDFFF